MTREYVIKRLQDKIECIEDGAICCVFGNDKEVFQMAIKALEQELILDKIRAEITTLQNRCYALTKGTMCSFCKYEYEYKAESEDKR